MKYVSCSPDIFTCSFCRVKQFQKHLKSLKELAEQVVLIVSHVVAHTFIHLHVNGLNMQIKKDLKKRTCFTLLNVSVSYLTIGIIRLAKLILTSNNS